MTTKTELVTREEGIPVQAVSQADSFLATIQQAASDPTVDMDKMERLYGMYKDVKANEARMAYNAAMAACQAEMPPIEKTHFSKQTKSHNAKIEDIIRAIKPVYTKHGFSVSIYPVKDAPEGFIRAAADVSHAGGDMRHFEYDNPIDDRGIAGTANKTQTHGRASGFTYAERYLMGMIFMLEITFVGQDDDGNSAEKEIKRITDEQALEIDAMITDNDLDREKFMRWVKQAIWVDAIEDIPADWYAATVKTIASAVKARAKA